LRVPRALGQLQMGNHRAIGSLLMGFTQIHVREDKGRHTTLSRLILISMYLGFLAMYRD
jgi:hypothetical protein